MVASKTLEKWDYVLWVAHNFMGKNLLG